jgi:hypothetical protein
VNRRSAVVVAVLDDNGVKVIVYRWYHRRFGWQYEAKDEWWWYQSPQWAIGPLPKPPKGAR